MRKLTLSNKEHAFVSIYVYGHVFVLVGIPYARLNKYVLVYMYVYLIILFVFHCKPKRKQCFFSKCKIYKHVSKDKNS